MNEFAVIFKNLIPILKSISGSGQVQPSEAGHVVGNYLLLAPVIKKSGSLYRLVNKETQHIYKRAIRVLTKNADTNYSYVQESQDSDVDSIEKQTKQLYGDTIRIKNKDYTDRKEHEDFESVVKDLYENLSQNGLDDDFWEQVDLLNQKQEFDGLMEDLRGIYTGSGKYEAIHKHTQSFLKLLTSSKELVVNEIEKLHGAETVADTARLNSLLALTNSEETVDNLVKATFGFITAKTGSLSSAHSLITNITNQLHTSYNFFNSRFVKTATKSSKDKRRFIAAFNVQIAAVKQTLDILNDSSLSIVTANTGAMQPKREAHRYITNPIINALTDNNINQKTKILLIDTYRIPEDLKNELKNVVDACTEGLSSTSSEKNTIRVNCGAENVFSITGLDKQKPTYDNKVEGHIASSIRQFFTNPSTILDPVQASYENQNLQDTGISLTFTGGSKYFLHSSEKAIIDNRGSPISTALFKFSKEKQIKNKTLDNLVDTLEDLLGYDSNKYLEISQELLQGSYLQKQKTNKTGSVISSLLDKMAGPAARLLIAISDFRKNETDKYQSLQDKLKDIMFNEVSAGLITDSDITKRFFGKYGFVPQNYFNVIIRSLGTALRLKQSYTKDKKHIDREESIISDINKNEILYQDPFWEKFNSDGYFTGSTTDKIKFSSTFSKQIFNNPTQQKIASDFLAKEFINTDKLAYIYETTSKMQILANALNTEHGQGLLVSEDNIEGQEFNYNTGNEFRKVLELAISSKGNTGKYFAIRNGDVTDVFNIKRGQSGGAIDYAVGHFDTANKTVSLSSYEMKSSTTGKVIFAHINSLSAILDNLKKFSVIRDRTKFKTISPGSFLNLGVYMKPNNKIGTYVIREPNQENLDNYTNFHLSQETEKEDLPSYDINYELNSMPIDFDGERALKEGKLHYFWNFNGSNTKFAISDHPESVTHNSLIERLSRFARQENLSKRTTI